jgi:hypothetical protein
MMEATQKLLPLLGKYQGSSAWRNNARLFRVGTPGPKGLLNLSPAWFQQGHEVTCFGISDSSSVADFQLSLYRNTLRLAPFSEIQAPWNG